MAPASMPVALPVNSTPSDPALRAAIRLALLFAAFKLTFHIVESLWEAHIGWGYYSDEMYYVLCGRHLAWGYVDHGPVVALQARIAETVFGDSLVGLRFLSELGGAARVFLTGLLAWSLGGRRPAQGLAMLAVILPPQYLGVDGYLSMNSWESAFWMTCLLALILILRTGTVPFENRSVPILWAIFGLSAGIGLLNKPSMLFFLIAVLAALLVTPQRRILASRWAATAVVLTVLITLPYIFWQAHNHWPTPQFLINARSAHPELLLSHRTFVHVQLNDMGTLLFPLWGAGFIRLLRRPNERWLGLVFSFFFFGMMAIPAKDYYVTPIYPILFAAGGVAWESYFAHRRGVAGDRVFAFPAYQGVIIVYGLITLPLALPILPPAEWIAYTTAMHLYRPSPFLMKFIGPLPPFFADRFGWQEEVDEVARIYAALPPEQQKITGILCSNYGEASAINFLGRRLPVAISPRNNYYLWGTNGYTGDSMIVIAELPREKLLQYFDSVEVAGYMTAPYSMAYEHQNVYLATGRKFEMAQLWPTLKAYF
jgi:4-amino-4-deoxy-L-arabinose transferase-like glycosyltransferase